MSTSTALITEEDRALLAALAHGPGTDDATARQLGISTRTLRRRLAPIMTQLGARTRF